MPNAVASTAERRLVMIWKALIWAILTTLVVSGAKADAYKLALTNMEGTDNTTSNDTGVVVMFASGKRVFGLKSTLPPSVRLIRDDPEWENSPPHIRKWFQGLMQPDHPRTLMRVPSGIWGLLATTGSQSSRVKAQGLPISPISPKAPASAFPTQK